MLPGQPNPAQRHAPGAPVWAHLEGAWCAAVVLAGSDRAATVRYRRPSQRGTAVETVAWPQISIEVRTMPDRAVDSPPRQSGGSGLL